ncbi:LysE family translocator [uncultured Shewanella sp.]|uniref:LysE family translocator n=1 Tax=uncultured Shewanella sp. TaxID=173975 RepID=UPI002615E10B|nr:LysE family translocator [uncultured Shewanella sp.]
MPDLTLLTLFIPTFFFVSITPGMCMTLAMTLGMSIGLRRTFWMMLGELIGIALVAISAALGAASIMLNYPHLFIALKWLGGIYLIYIGINMWRAKGKMALATHNQVPDVNNRVLMSQGFITAIANPKGWAFMISLLPPFIHDNAPVTPQLIALVGIIMITEFVSMTIYASGGKSLKLFLSRGDNVKWMNRLAGTLMIAVGVWLALD